MTGVDTRPRVGRIRAVDGLRGVAILSVLLWHYFASMAVVPRHSPIAATLALLRLSWSGVDLFFVISGFLIGGILLDARDSTGYFATFYRRRFFRIIPLYAVLGLAYAIASLSGGEHWRGAAGHWIFGNPPPWYGFPLFLQNVFLARHGTFNPLTLGVTWSLAVEEQFYLTLPLLVRFVSRRRLVQILAAVALFAPVLRTLTYRFVPHGGLVAYVSTPTRADALLAGVFVAMVVRSPEAWHFVERRRTWLKAAAIGLAAGALVAMARDATEIGSILMSTVGYSALALLYAIVLLLALSGPSGRLGRLLDARWLRALGGIAYGTYLLHVTVLGVCFGLVLRRDPRLATLADLGVTMLAMASTLLIAQLSWNLFERRFVRFGQRYAYGAPGSAPGQRPGSEPDILPAPSLVTPEA